MAFMTEKNVTKCSDQLKIPINLRGSSYTGMKWTPIIDDRGCFSLTGKELAKVVLFMLQ
jgi:hypothetical protein